MKRTPLTIAAAALVIVALGAQQPAAPAPQQPAPSQQPSDVTTTISSGGVGTPPRFAVPDFIALSKDAETVDAARAIPRVLLDDLNFEHEFALIPRDVYATIPAATSMYDVPLDRWREVNECKYLFAPKQAWTRGDARDFAKAAWNHLGYA